MTHRKTLPLLMAAILAATPAFAGDGFDFIGGAAQTEKPAKAPREKNDGRGLETMVKSFGAGMGVGAAGVTMFGAAALGPLMLVGAPILAVRMTEDQIARESAFYAGTVTRGRVEGLNSKPVAEGNFDKPLGIDQQSFPSAQTLIATFNTIGLDVDGPSKGLVFAFVHKASGIQKGDIVDIKFPVNMFAQNTKVFDNLHFDFNKHMPRVVNVYCKHDNPACQNDYDSSLGVLYRHTDTEFPPSQYLIDPAIIAADQAKMKQEAEEKKAAQNSGGFNFM